MSESFIKIPSCLAFNPELTSLELRVLMALIFWSGINTQEPGHIKYGAEKLGQQIGIGRTACRKALLTLQNLNLITINHRGNLTNESYGISNDIELTLQKGIEFLRNGGSVDRGDLDLNNPGHLHLKDTGQGEDLHLKDTGYLNHLNPDLDHLNPHLHLKDTGHIDDRFKININLNKIPRTVKRTHNAPTDVAVGRSMPDGGQAAKSSAGDEEVSAGAAKTKNQILVDDMRAAFTDIFADLSLSMAGNTYILRKKGKYALIEDVRLREVLYWMMRRGLDARILDPNTRVLGETLLEEVA